jgi:hypothetical protein
MASEINDPGHSKVFGRIFTATVKHRTSEVKIFTVWMKQLQHYFPVIVYSIVPPFIISG